MWRRRLACAVPGLCRADMSRAVALSPLLAIALAATPASAATTVRVAAVHPGGPEQENRGVLVTDESGDRNALTISYSYEGGPRSPAMVTVEDTSAALEAGRRCAETQPGRVRCEVELLAGIRAELGGGRDAAKVEPPGKAACNCVALQGNAGDDRLSGGNGVDRLSGGDGDDRLHGRAGNDLLRGDADDDLLRGGKGRDLLFGGSTFFIGDPNPPAGSDELRGGTGHDTFDDLDEDSGEIGPDMLVGGRGDDTIRSYEDRKNRVVVDLRRRSGQGEAGEGDSLVNVENVSGGDGDDSITGDADDNALSGGVEGSDRLRGLRGDDLLDASVSLATRAFGGRGNDIAVVRPYSTGSVRCGRGADHVEEPAGGNQRSEWAKPDDPGPRLAASCEHVAWDLDGGWGIEPVPARPAARRTLFFERPAAAAHRRTIRLAVTDARKPYRELGRGVSTRRGVSVRVPRRIARRVRRKGMNLRAEVWDKRHARPGDRLRIIWRFRVASAGESRQRPGAGCPASSSATARTAC